jgi:hypothetical protein
MLVVLRVKEFPPFLWGIFISRRACLLLDMSLKTIFGVVLLFSTSILRSQTLGGSSVYNFMKLPMGGQLSALGGKNVSLFSSDVSLIFENPALLRKDHHAFISSSFNNIAPSTNALQGVGAYHHQQSNTSFALGMLHLLYGQEMQTDASGNSLGTFRAYDQLISASFSKSYGKRWYYGASIKLAHSNFGVFRSTGLAADVGLTYYDEGKKLQFGFAAKNMGTQLRTYGGMAEDLPFDLVIGMTKQLEKAPLRFSVTAQRLHQFDLLYNDTLYNNENFGSSNDLGLAKKIFSHFVLGTELLLGDKLVILAGYNVLRRNELSIKNIASGLTGFSYGLQLKLNRLHFYYARSHYQSTIVQNQLTLSVRLTANQK